MAERLTMFQVIAHLNGARPWGAVLDAGTGVRSACWLAGIGAPEWTAVSADAAHLAETRQAIGARLRPQDRLIAGNWADPEFLAGEQFDTVIAEYLLGAVEGYAPYFQSSLFARLRPLVRGRIYVVGVDPYVFAAPVATAGGPKADDPGCLIVQEVARFRDACATLAGVRPYREYPAEWVMDALAQAGLHVIEARRFPNAYGADWVARQIGDSRRLLAACPDLALRAALEGGLHRLEVRAGQQIARTGALVCGHDHVIVAEPAPIKR